MWVLSANIFFKKICSIFEWRAYHGSFMTPKGSKLDLRSILVDGGPAKNCLGLQKENVGEEEACHVLDEIDFSETYMQNICWYSQCLLWLLKGLLEFLALVYKMCITFVINHRTVFCNMNEMQAFLPWTVSQSGPKLYKL